MYSYLYRKDNDLMRIIMHISIVFSSTFNVQWWLYVENRAAEKGKQQSLIKVLKFKFVLNNLFNHIIYYERKKLKTTIFILSQLTLK